MEISVLRPWAFVFLFPAVLFCFFRLRAVKTWLGIVDAHLLKPLLVRVCVRFGEGIKIGLLGLSCLSVLCALAGVSVSGRQKSLYFPKSPAVIVLDMSLSMKVQDISPNRFSRAVFKTYDLLDELKGIPTALIVFTDEPYQLVPTTTEKQAIEALLPLLNFNLLPSRGSRPDRAIEEALRTIKEAGADFGDIFLITDGADDILELQDKTADLVRLAAGQGNRLFILGIGTPQGGALFEKEDTPVLDTLGNPVVHRLKEGWLRRLAGLGNGRYVRARTDGSDVTALINAQKSRLEAGEQSALTDDQSFSDEGYWFLILPLSVFPFLFRRGRLLGILFIFAFSSEALAVDAAELFLSPSAAAMHFLNGGNQAKAIEIAARSDDFTALYNVGTQLIFLQNYSKAQELLEKAVQKRPEDENAQINLEIARRLNQPPPSDSPESNSNDETQNPDNSGEKEGESEGQSNLNQDNNNDLQLNDNKENNESEKSGNSENSPPGSADDERNADNDQSDQNGPSGGGQGQGGAPEDQEGSPDQNNNGSGDPGNGENSENRTENPDNMVPVHEDPLTLLRHKILFLYQEKRYADEKPIGTQW